MLNLHCRFLIVFAICLQNNMPFNLDFYTEATDDLSFLRKGCILIRYYVYAISHLNCFQTFVCEAQGVKPICINKKHELDTIYQGRQQHTMEVEIKKSVKSIIMCFNKHTSNSIFKSFIYVYRCCLIETSRIFVEKE